MVIRVWCVLHAFHRQVKNGLNPLQVRPHELNQGKRYKDLLNLLPLHLYLQLMHLLHLQLALLQLHVPSAQAFHFRQVLSFLLLPLCASYALTEFSIFLQQAIRLVLKSNNVNGLSHIYLLERQIPHALILLP